MADRFFTPEPLALGEFILDGPEAHHLVHVRRFSTGDTVNLFNGDGREYEAEIREISKKRVVLNLLRMRTPQRELGFVLHIGAALPKGDRADFLIEKLTELGVTDFTPLLTERSVVLPKESKTEKLQRAVIEASKQCGRNVLLRVHPPARLERWCQLQSIMEAKWIAHPTDELGGSKEAIRGGIAVAIGPEGGFSDEEVAAAERAGFRRLGLGPRILRVETAAVAIAAQIGSSLN